MYNRRWSDLKKVNDGYEFEPETTDRTKCSLRVNFTQLAFDCDEERLVVADTAGHIYYVDLSNSSPSYLKLGYIGQVTFVAFNPIDKSEILIGLTTAKIKIVNIHESVDQFCLLIGHKLPPFHISFYQNYCLTCSRKEVIIWCLRSCNNAHQLKVNTKNVVVKKASFSSLGHVVVLYHNDTIQAWIFKQLETDTKIDAKSFNIRNIKDFVFTRNGRALIMAGMQNKIVVLNTCNWELLSTFSLPENFIGIRQLSVVPTALDGGANKVLACVSSKCMLRFFDLNFSCFIDTLRPLKPIKKIAISPNGRFLAYIEQEGNLRLVFAEKMFAAKCEQGKRLTDHCRPIAHRASDHLTCVRRCIKEELNLERLLPILKEFGEYPDKYRLLIWSTILKLPANKSSYCALVNKAACTELSLDLLKNYPLASRSNRTLLTTTMNCLIQWCPLLVQSSFVPNLIFPFLMVFQKDVLLAFELVLMIFLNFCQKWFEYHPLPPLNVLGIIENVLLEADPSLLNVFCERGITSSEYAWPLLKTAMSEVLSASEWLILWDHLLSFQKPSLLLMCVIAYSICSRETITTGLHSPESIKQFYTTQGHVTAKELLKVARQLDKDIPLRIHPSRYIRNDIVLLPSKGPYTPFVQKDFPKFLTEESVFDFERTKEKERIAEERDRKAMEIAEERRLRHEREIFINQIHEARLNEVQKCIQQQAYQMDWPFKKIPQKPESGRMVSERVKRIYDVPFLHNLRDEDFADSKEEKSLSCEHLQRSVDKLEYEVQSLLNSLRSQRTEVDIT